MSSLRPRPLLAMPLAFVLLLTLTGAALAEGDTTPPVGTLTVNHGNLLTNDPWHVHLDVPATDAESGLAVIQLKVNGGGPMVIDYAPEIDLALPWWQDGSNTIEVRWQDMTGNLSGPAQATLIVDLIAPYAKVTFYDVAPGGVTFDVVPQDAADVADLVFYCEDQSVPAVRPYDSRVTVNFGAGGLECGSHYGLVQVKAGARDAAGNEFLQIVDVYRIAQLELAAPLAAVTGQPFTVTPILPADYVLSPGSGCRWEFRWGNDASLDDHDVDETYGSLLFDIPASGGKCKPWTFTLPWVPYRQYEAYVSVFTDLGGGAVEYGSSASYRFMADVGSTERRILSSSLPIAQVLPSTYTPIVDQPITYTRYLIGGASACCNARWTARLGNGETPTQWTQSGGTTFTFTPRAPGNLVVGWDRAAGNLLLAAVYDPPARYRDTTPPTATPPSIRASDGAVHGKVPVEVRWTGADKGWGVASYGLQRSLDGGGWTNEALKDPSARSSLRWVPAGHVVRYRVRAVDEAGNVGLWATGAAASIRPKPHAPVALGRGVPIPTGSGGSLAGPVTPATPFPDAGSRQTVRPGGAFPLLHPDRYVRTLDRPFLTAI